MPKKEPLPLRRLLLILAILPFAAWPAPALCDPDYDAIDPIDEFAAATYVVVGEAIHIDDRLKQFYTGNDSLEFETYDLISFRVLDALKGVSEVNNVLKIQSSNDSARFPVDLNQRYLLFVSRRPGDSVLFINNCGASAPIGGLDDVPDWMRETEPIKETE